MICCAARRSILQSPQCGLKRLLAHLGKLLDPCIGQDSFDRTRDVLGMLRGVALVYQGKSVIFHMGFHGKTTSRLGGEITSILETGLNELGLTLKMFGDCSRNGLVFSPCTRPPFAEMVRVMVSPERQKLAISVLSTKDGSHDYFPP